MNPHIEVLPVGTMVAIGPCQGIILAICIRQNDSITYSIGWWDGATSKEAWFTPMEIKAPKPSLRIGYKSV